MVNFIGSRDRISGFSKFYGMGASGKKGFIYPSPNLNQHYTDWKHSDFVKPENFELIRDEVFKEN